MKFKILLTSVLVTVCSLIGTLPTLAQDRLPVREYTNPNEIVTFDRSTPYNRAIDVVNQFAQQYTGKIIIDRTSTDGELGITIPPMHWRDALGIILRTKYLQLVEQPDYFEIVPARSVSERTNENGQLTVLPDTALSTDSKEVRINAIFFEGNRRALQEIGVDWSTLTENVPANISQFVSPQQGGGGGGGGGGEGGGGGQQGQLPDVGNFDGPFVSVNSKGAQSVSQNVFSSLINFGDVFGSGISVQALFSAFEADNLGEILASPSVKVLEGHEGHIQVGQDFSIKQRDFAGNVTDQFFSVGTILNVTPQIIEQSDTTFIHLNIEAERSSAQPDPVSTVINKQNATTQTLLLNGEATVIAGLYRTEASEVRRGVPILKDLPGWFFGLRYIFGYNSKDYTTRELVILLQASIEPSIPERLAQERFPNKFDVLEKERIRIQNDIKNYRDSRKDVVPPKGKIDSVAKDQMQGNLKDKPDNNVRMKEAESNDSQNKALANQVETLQKELEEAQENIKKYKETRTETPPPVKVKNEPAEEHTVQAETPVTNSTSVERPEQEPEKNVSEPQNTVKPKAVQRQASEVASKNKRRVKNKYHPVSDADESYTYYLIGGSFQDKVNAEDFSGQLFEEGYDPRILKKDNGSFYLVAYSGYKSWPSVKQSYDEVVASVNENAWVYENN